MKKRIWMLLCVLAVLMGCMAVSASADATRTAYCEACKATVSWEPIVYGKLEQAVGDPAVHLHYYLTKSKTSTSVSDQMNMKGKVTLCLDLNGYTWESYGRALIVSKSDNGCSTVNLMDTKGGGQIIGMSKKTGASAGTNNIAGGTIWVASGCELNIYSGTYVFNGQQSDYGLRTDNGGTAYVDGGTLNLYGGTVKGGSVNKSGGAVYLLNAGKLNAYDGTITAGSSGNGTGGCVSLKSTGCAVTLGGNAKIDDIYIPSVDASYLMVDGDYTGEASVTYKAGVTLSVGTTVGTTKNNGTVSGEIYCTNGYSMVVDGNSLKLAEPLVEDVRYDCPHCKQNVKWEVFTTTAPTTAGTYHYYLDKDYGTAAAKQWNIKNGAQVCVDLHGHSYTTEGRAMGVSGTGSMLSILDTVGSGSVNGTAAGNNPGGGTITVSSSTVFNLYSGTLTFTHDPDAMWGGTGRGGVIQNSSGTMNIYGGKIVGGEVVDCTYEFTGIEGAGGAIYNNGTLNLLGGEITMGIAPESGAGPCIYNVSGKKITLGGTAQVADIYFADNVASAFTVHPDFTGSAQLSYPDAVVLHQGLVVGICTADDWQGTITCNNDRFPTAMPMDGNLVISAYPVGTVAATGGMGYTTLQAAVDAAQEGALVELLGSVAGDLNVTKDLTLQLNGCDVAGTVTVAEGKTLYGMDSSTTDYTVADGKYGKLTAVVGKVAGAVADSDSYIVIAEADGISFHCVTLQIYAMTLRTDENDQPGLYYKSHFKADEKAAPVIATYGVALSVVDIPTAETMDELGSYTIFEKFESGPLGNLGNASSTLLKGILKNSYSEKKNLQNLALTIYGRAYAKTADGQTLMGSPVQRSLAQQLESIDAMVSTLSATQINVVTNMYNTFKTTLQTMELPGIRQAVQTNEEGILKILILGNSHSLDATNLLYEVFHTEAPEQKLVVGALYYSGCTVQQHKNFLTNNEKVYTYHKNDGSQPNRTWVVKDATCLDALKDEQWDIIFMQATGASPTLLNSDWQVVADYLMNNQDIAPKLALHYSWTCPDDYELYLNDDAPYNHPLNPASWRNKLERLYGVNGKYNQAYMYQLSVAALRENLIDSTDLVGRAFDLVIPTCTTIQYAHEILGRDHEELYRDYTHVNDYGRLMVAYTWYAYIMELEELTEVNLDAIPAVLKHRNSKFPAADADGNYIVTEDMKADILKAVNWTMKNPWNLPTE